MVGAGRQALTWFVGELQRLRRLAGAPSLNQLVALTAGHERPLPRSTISDKLNAKTVPEWDFVASFVTACKEHAEKMGIPLPADAVDMAWWDTAHWRMLRDIDEADADVRLTSAARAALSRRVWRTAPGPDPPPDAPPATQEPRTSQAPTQETRTQQNQAPGTRVHQEPPAVVPRQLPAAVRHFAGRSADLERLDNLMDDAGSADRVVMVAIAGTAGIGKTTLAVHWAHRMAARFPDGQLHINLRGFDPAGTAVTPSEAIRGFLVAFGVPPAQLPLNLDAQGALYRSLLAGRRMLVLLDNARDADQVYPLLPGSPGCLVIVTSRNRLTGLVAAAGAHPLTLDLFTPVESRELLTHLLGPERVIAEPRAVDDIVAWCARLPLALSIVAARAAARPGFSLASLASRAPPVRAAPGGLDAFDGGDTATDVRSVFSWSYRQLTAEAAALFRLLGLQPGPDIAISAVASLAGHPVGRVGRPLSELAAAHLVEEPAPDRYACHDLLRAYATELAESMDPPAHRRQAVHRILDHYLHSSHAAALLLNPDRDPLALSHAEPGVTPAQLTDDRQALGWLMAEHRALLAAIDLAVAGGFDRHVWQLAWTLANFLDRQGHWYAWVETQTAALEAAKRLADRAGQAHAHRALGGGYARLGRTDEARTHIGHALNLYGQLGDIPGEARTYLNLGWLSGQEGQHEQALHHARQALDLFRAAGQVAGQASTLNAIGWCHALLGDHAGALVHCDQARTLHRELGDRLGEAASLDSLGYAHSHLGHHAQAVACYQQALELYRDLDNQVYAADVLSHLGDAHQAAGDPAASLVAWQSALGILDQLGHPQADGVRAKLRGIDPAGR